MAKFELYITLFLKDDEVKYRSEINSIICWVDDVKDEEEVKKTAYSVIGRHLDDMDGDEKNVLFGSGTVVINSVNTTTICFRNTDNMEDHGNIIDLLFADAEEEGSLH